MEYLLSLVYVILDVGCILIFLSSLASRRFADARYGTLVGLYIASYFGVMLLCMTFFNYDAFIKISLALLCSIVFCRILYTNISLVYLAFVLILQYIITYALSFTSLCISAIVCGVSIQSFQQAEVTPFVISSAVYYFLEVFLMLLIRKIIRNRNKLKDHLKQNSAQIVLYLTFPVASFAMLLILLRITSKQGLSDEFIVGCSWMIFIANAAILYLLDQMETQRQNREQLLALNQQLQLQEKSMREITDLYSSQRKQVHDFRAHLKMLNQLLDEKQYLEVKKYLKSISDQQIEHTVFVNCNHTVLDALFNLKALEAVKNNINIHFEVADLSQLPFDPIDLTVLLSNLFDNAIEGCQKCFAEQTIRVLATMKKGCFCFIIRNTSNPVNIIDNEISTTKSDSYLHGYGLTNIKTILAKYNGEYTMSYKNGHFQFIFEIPL